MEDVNLRFNIKEDAGMTISEGLECAWESLEELSDEEKDSIVVSMDAVNSKTGERVNLYTISFKEFCDMFVDVIDVCHIGDNDLDALGDVIDKYENSYLSTDEVDL